MYTACVAQTAVWVLLGGLNMQIIVQANVYDKPAEVSRCVIPYDS